MLDVPEAAVYELQGVCRSRATEIAAIYDSDRQTAKRRDPSAADSVDTPANDHQIEVVRAEPRQISIHRAPIDAPFRGQAGHAS